MFKVGKAFCPGHVTGFFEICTSEQDPLRRGSRGAGFSMTLGARSDCMVEPRDSQRITVAVHALEGMTGGDVSIRAIRNLIGDAKVKVEVETDLELPLSQGFGMSGAGALSAALSLVDAYGQELGKTREDAVKAAHVAEVESKTGLGDVVGQAVGGFERRFEPGAPPYGSIEHEARDDEVVLCVLGGAIHTKLILVDPVHRRKIIEAGRKVIASYPATAGVPEFCEASWQFARESNLATKEIENAIEAIRPHGYGSMAMLGHSVFAFGDADAIEKELKKHGKTFRCRIAPEGAHIVKV